MALLRRKILTTTEDSEDLVRIFLLSLLEPVDKGLRGPSHLASSLLLAALLVPREKDFLLEQVDIIECLEQVGRLAEQRLEVKVRVVCSQGYGQGQGISKTGASCEP